MNKENSDTYSVTCRCPRLLFFVLAAALVFGAVCVGGVSGADVWDGDIDIEWVGEGTKDNPYLITSAAELAGLAQKVNGGETYSEKYFKLTTDIDLNNREWTPIGNIDVTARLLNDPSYGEPKNPFGGNFNGDNHVISNMSLHITSDVEYNWFNSRVFSTPGGLFGYVTGSINDLTLTSSSISIGGIPAVVGSIVGILDGGSVSDTIVMDTRIYLEDGWGDTGTSVVGYIAGGVVGDNVGGKGSVSVSVAGVDNNINIQDKDSTFWRRVHVDDIVAKGGVGSSSGSGGSGNEKPSRYFITTTCGDNGIITPLGEIQVTAGGSSKTTITPNSGYAIDKILLDLVDVTQGNVTGDGRDETIFTIENVMQNYSIHVSFRYSPEFTITIPDSLKLDNRTNTGRMNIIVEDVWLPEKDRILIKVSSSNEFDLVHSWDNNIRLDYELTAGSSTTPLSNNDVVGNITQAEYDAQNSLRIEIPLNAIVTSTPKFAGEYGDTLTFTVIRD